VKFMALNLAKDRLIAAAVGLAALGLLLMGSVSKHKVFESAPSAFGINPFTRVSERQLIMDSTFGGAKLEGGRLVTTYDRLKPSGKRACPT